jgi:REP-associated tyrosine transposase
LAFFLSLQGLSLHGYHIANMPSKNSIKTYVEDGYYHVYNRGINKNKIFKDDQDYKVFLVNLKNYLTPLPPKDSLTKTFTFKKESFKGIPRQPKNYHQLISLVAFCLMPNHFHLLVKQKDSHDLSHFMRSIGTKYSMYFNKKYQRTGPLFQGRYKAVLIDKDEYLLHLSRYIHQNPKEITKDLSIWYSSYSTYLGKFKLDWVNTKPILEFFNTNPFPNQTFNSYQNFVEDNQTDSESILGDLTLNKTAR